MTLQERFKEFLENAIRTDKRIITDEDIEMLKEVNLFVDKVLFPNKEEKKDD